MYSQFWLENLKGRNNPEDFGVCLGMILEWILKKYDGKMCTGFISLRIGTSSGLL